LAETIFFCEDEPTKEALVEDGAEPWSVYTRDELQVLVAQNRVAPLSDDELRKVHDLKASRKSIAGASIPRKATTRKRKIDEKASLNCSGDKWICFRSGAAFCHSDFHRNSLDYWNRDGTGLLRIAWKRNSCVGLAVRKTHFNWSSARPIVCQKLFQRGSPWRFIPNFNLTVPILKLDPSWDPLRSDSRFQALIEKHSAKI
jgi:hypothetical protein